MTTFPVKIFFLFIDVLDKAKYALILICIHPGTKVSGYVHDNQSKY